MEDNRILALSSLFDALGVIEKGIEKEATTPPSTLIHLLGSIVGVCYLYFFKRESFSWLVRDVKSIANWVKRRVRVWR